MTKKVSVRRWSVDKFTAAVKAALKKAGHNAKVAQASIEKAYKAGESVAYTVSKLAK
jgi:hypothetical protein